MRIGSLFSGAGGLDLAVEQVFGGRTVWHSEIDPAASEVLTHRWPGVPNLGDITEVDWTLVEWVDVLCAGFPCQDVSAAGRQAGLQAGTRTGLFLSIVEAIRVMRPRVVVLENVLGLLSADGDVWPAEVVALDREAQRWGRICALIRHKKAKAERKGNRDRQWRHRKQREGIRASRRYKVALAEFRRERLRLVPRAIDTVLRSLAEVGYDTQWHCIRASDIGAPHQRARIFILATDAQSNGRARVDDSASSATACSGWERLTGRGIGIAPAADADDTTRHRQWACTQSRQGSAVASDSTCDGRDQGGPESEGVVRGSDAAQRGHGTVDLLPTPRRSDGDGGANPLHRAERMDDVETRVIRLLNTPSCADGGGGHLTRSGARGDEPLLPGQAVEMAQRWGKYEPAIRRWEQITRPAPSPTEPNTKGDPRLAAAFPEWMQGWPDGWVTAVPGISRNDQLRIIGNGVCPQQAVAALWQLIPVAHHESEATA